MTSSTRLKGLTGRDAQSAPEGSKAILKGALTQIGYIPNMYANMANSPGLLGTYRFGYDAFRKDSGFSDTEQEVVFLAISRFHSCTYCVAVHSGIAKLNKVPSEVIDALRNGSVIVDPKLETLRQFTEEMVDTRGRPTPESLSRFLDAGYTEIQVLEIILAIAVKTISNYSNHQFDTSLDSRFAPYEWQV